MGTNITNLVSPSLACVSPLDKVQVYLLYLVFGVCSAGVQESGPSK